MVACCYYSKPKNGGKCPRARALGGNPRVKYADMVCADCQKIRYVDNAGLPRNIEKLAELSPTELARIQRLRADIIRES